MGLLQAAAKRLGFTPAAEAQALIARERQGALLHARQLSAAMMEHFTTNWQGTAEHINVETAAGLSKARARSRDAALNNDHARRFVGMAKTNMVGPVGVRLQVQVAKRGGQLDTAINSAIEQAWLKWGQRGNCDVTGRYSWLAIQNLIARHLVVDGEMFVRLVTGRGPHRFQVQLFDPALVDLDKRGDGQGANRVRMGVEFDGEGRPVACYVRQDVPGSPDGYTGARHMRVPAEEILHIMLPEQVMQLRGVPWMNSALKRLYLINDFEQAALNASRNAAKRAGFFKSVDGGAPPGMGSIEGTGDDAARIAPTQDGQFDVLPEGYDFTPFQSAFPHVNHGEFVKSCLRSAASGLGASYVTFGNDLEAVNYSSARVGIFEERETWKGLQQWLIDELHTRIAPLWLKYALLAEPLLARLAPDRLDDYVAAMTWQPRRWPSIDPVKDANADEMRLRMGLTSRRRIAAREGDDLDEIAAELTAEKEQFAGLLPEPAMPNGAPAQPAATDPEEDPQGTADAKARALRVVASRAMEQTQ